MTQARVLVVDEPVVCEVLWRYLARGGFKEDTDGIVDLEPGADDQVTKLFLAAGGDRPGAGGPPAGPAGRRAARTGPPGRAGSPPVSRAGDWRDRDHPRRGHNRSGAGLLGVVEEQLPAAWHRGEQYENNRVECDHRRLKARLRPMRGRKQDRSTRVLLAGHALVQNVRRGHYELAVEEPAGRRLAIAFEELALAI